MFWKPLDEIKQEDLRRVVEAERRPETESLDYKQDRNLGVDA